MADTPSATCQKSHIISCRFTFSQRMSRRLRGVRSTANSKGSFTATLHKSPSRPDECVDVGLGGVRTSPEVQPPPAKAINERFEIRAPSAPCACFAPSAESRGAAWSGRCQAFFRHVLEELCGI